MSIPADDIIPPRRVRALADGAALTPVWRNGRGGLTFRTDDGRFITYGPRNSETSMSGEATRLAWAAPFSPVPEVLGAGADDTDEWLVTRALPGRSAVDPRWLADPETAVRAVGEQTGRMEHPVMFDDADPLLRRVREIALALPDAAEKITHGRPTFHTTKVFAYFGGAPRGETGRRHDAALLLRPDADDEPALRQDPRFWEPAYLWPHGWLGVDLDARTDWTEVAELLDASYRATAPRRLVQLLDAR